MNSYRYRVTVEKLCDGNGEPVYGQSLSFYAASHDDILALVERLQSKLPFSANTTAALGVGLKLFSEVALIHRKDSIFSKIRPPLSEFMQQLKQRTEVVSAV